MQLICPRATCGGVQRRTLLKGSRRVREFGTTRARAHLAVQFCGLIKLAAMVQCGGQGVGSTHPLRVIFGQVLRFRPPRVCQLHLHLAGKPLPARPAPVPPSKIDFLAFQRRVHPVGRSLCPTRHVCQPCVPTASASRLDGRWINVKADDARPTARPTRGCGSWRDGHARGANRRLKSLALLLVATLFPVRLLAFA